MDLENKASLMEIFIKECMQMEIHREKEDIFGNVESFMMEYFREVLGMEKED